MCFLRAKEQQQRELEAAKREAIEQLQSVYAQQKLQQQQQQQQRALQQQELMKHVKQEPDSASEPRTYKMSECGSSSSSRGPGSPNSYDQKHSPRGPDSGYMGSPSHQSQGSDSSGHNLGSPCSPSSTPFDPFTNKELFRSKVLFTVAPLSIHGQ